MRKSRFHPYILLDSQDTYGHERYNHMIERYDHVIRQFDDHHRDLGVWNWIEIALDKLVPGFLACVQTEDLDRPQIDPSGVTPAEYR